MSPTFYLFHGDDDLSIDEYVAKFRSEMGDDANAALNISEFDGTIASVPEIIGAVTSYPFLADRRLVIVKGLIGWLTRKGAGQIGKEGIGRLMAELPVLPEYSRLVLVERQLLPDKNEIVKLAAQSENGYARAFTVPKDTTTWIIKRALSEYNVVIENRAAAALAAVTGDDLRRADNELLKLASYVETGKPITEEDVALLTPYVPEANIFRLVDAIADGRGEQALTLLHRLLAEKGEDVLRTYGMIVRQFRLLLQTKEHLMMGGTIGNMTSTIGVKGFVAQNLARQARGFMLRDLEHIYRELAEIDFKMKTGQIEPELAVDLFIASLAREK